MFPSTSGHKSRHASSRSSSPTTFFPQPPNGLILIQIHTYLNLHLRLLNYLSHQQIQLNQFSKTPQMCDSLSALVDFQSYVRQKYLHYAMVKLFWIFGFRNIQNKQLLVLPKPLFNFTTFLHFTFLLKI